MVEEYKELREKEKRRRKGRKDIRSGRNRDERIAELGDKEKR